MQRSTDHFASGPSKIPSMNLSKEVGSRGWGILPGNNSYHASSDASLFSCSLPVLPHEKLNVNVEENGGQSIDDASSKMIKLHLDMEGDELLEESANPAIGSLLPDDEDALLAGIMDDFDFNALPNQADDVEDYDLFGSGGGMELDSDLQESLSMSLSKASLSDGVVGTGVAHYSLPNGAGTLVGEHPYGEHPSRTLFVRNINSNVEDSELRNLFEQYGDIRNLYTACKHRGFVMISYYDIRAARTAMRALQNKPLRRRKLDIHFSIPKDNPSDKDMNQGTLVIFNLDPSVSNDDLRQIFGAYGEIKEIRETPHKRHHKFIEFYDVRAAEAALRSLNRSDIAGKRIKLEPSRPGGARRNLMLQLNQELEQDESWGFRHPVGSSVANSPPGNWPQFGSPLEHSPLQSLSKSPVLASMSPTVGNNLSGLASILHPQVLNRARVAPIGKNHAMGSHIEHMFTDTNSTQRAAAIQQSHSFPEPKLSSLGASSSNGSGFETLSGPQFLWGSPKPYPEQNNSLAWQPPSTGNQFAPNGRSHGFPYSGHNTSLIRSFQQAEHHVGSAPSGVPYERHFGFYRESPESSFPGPVAFGGMGIGRNDRNFMVNMGAHAALSSGLAVSGNLSENSASGYRMMSSPQINPMFLNNGHYPTLSPASLDALTDRGRSRRVESNGNQMDSKKQFQLDLDKIRSGDDARTTLMIKNIPNKYTSKMLLAAIDESHKGTYDFLYLPIDFKNKCNVGYAFINMLSPSHIIPFYQVFNGKKWEKFNSEKVASLAYARIQGKAALVNHFQNSSLMNEDKRCRPILFHSESSDVGDQIFQEHIPSSSLNFLVGLPNGSHSGESPGSPRNGGSGENPQRS